MQYPYICFYFLVITDKVYCLTTIPFITLRLESLFLQMLLWGQTTRPVFHHESQCCPRQGPASVPWLWLQCQLWCHYYMYCYGHSHCHQSGPNQFLQIRHVYMCWVNADYSVLGTACSAPGLSLLCTHCCLVCLSNSCSCPIVLSDFT
jgi:hypothetical protein